VLVAALLAAGCSSGGNPRQPAITKASFIAQANAICDAGTRDMQAARKAVEKVLLSGGASEAAIVSFVTRSFIPSVQDQLDKLRALAVPPVERATVAHLLALAQADLDRVKRKPAIVAGGHPFSNFALRAHPYGLTACAKVG
jgi:hypothetical protein